jgi:hypothetical protein
MIRMMLARLIPIIPGVRMYVTCWPLEKLHEVLRCSPRHGERSEAIQKLASERTGLLRRFAPRNDGQGISPRSRGTRRPSCACSVESTRVSHHGCTGITRHAYIGIKFITCFCFWIMRLSSNCSSTLRSVRWIRSPFDVLRRKIAIWSPREDAVVRRTRERWRAA